MNREKTMETYETEGLQKANSNNLKFYQFNQNNSGGGFAVDENVALLVTIQATNEYEAITKAKDVGIYFDGVDRGWDCSCCGDRWSEDCDEVEDPKSVQLYKACFSLDVDYKNCNANRLVNIVYYADGTKKLMYFKDCNLVEGEQIITEYFRHSFITKGGVELLYPFAPSSKSVAEKDAIVKEMLDMAQGDKLIKAIKIEDLIKDTVEIIAVKEQNNANN